MSWHSKFIPNPDEQKQKSPRKRQCSIMISVGVMKQKVCNPNLNSAKTESPSLMPWRGKSGLQLWSSSPKPCSNELCYRNSKTCLGPFARSASLKILDQPTFLHNYQDWFAIDPVKGWILQCITETWSGKGERTSSHLCFALQVRGYGITHGERAGEVESLLSIGILSRSLKNLFGIGLLSSTSTCG